MQQDNNRITVYMSRQRQRSSTWQTYKTMFANMWRTRWFIWILFARDYFMANKRSFLGYGWLFLAPLLSSLSWIFMNMLGVLNTGEMTVPFPIFVLIGTSLWVLFINTYNNSISLFDSASGMLGSVKFPHESLIMVQTMKALANFLISSILNAAILLMFGIYPNIYWLLLPFMLIPLIFLALSFGLVIMIIRYAIPDLERVFAFLFPMLMYITPIVFLPTEKSERFFFIIKYNPLTYLIGIPRDLILFGSSTWWSGYAISASVSVFVVFIALRVFYIAEEYLIEKLY